MRPIEVRLRSLAILAAGLALFACCKRDETKTLLEPSQALGPVLAEEAMRAAGVNRKIAVISHDADWGPPSSVEQAFKAALEKQGFSAVIVKSAHLGDPMRRGGIGLQPDDFFEAARNATDAGAIVSFVGAPLLASDDATRLSPGHPPILVVATRNLGGQLGVPGKPERLAGLLQAKVIQVAIVDGGLDSDALASDRSDATHRLFARNYSILRQPQ